MMKFIIAVEIIDVSAQNCSVWNISGLLITPLTGSSPGIRVGLALLPASQILPTAQPCRTSEICTPASLLISQITIQVLRGASSFHSQAFQIESKYMCEERYVFQPISTLCQSVWTDFLHYACKYIFIMCGRWLVIFLIRQLHCVSL